MSYGTEKSMLTVVSCNFNFLIINKTIKLDLLVSDGTFFLSMENA